MNFLNHLPQPILIFPLRVVGLETPHVADVPDVIADAVVLDVRPAQFAAGDLLAQVDRLSIEQFE
jgi:hypothetical protein